MRDGAIFVLTFCVILGCARRVKHLEPPQEEFLPPVFTTGTLNDLKEFDNQLLSLLEKNPDRASRWWIQFRRGTLWKIQDPNLSCEKFADLAREDLFPLRELARIYAEESCAADSPLLQGLKELTLENSSVWLKELVSRVLVSKKPSLGIEDDKNTPSRGEKSRSAIQEKWIENVLHRITLKIPAEEKVTLLLQILNSSSVPTTNLEIEKQLHRFAPRLKPNPAPREWLSTANDFRRNRDFAKSREYYQKILGLKNASFELKLKAHNGLRMAFKNERRLEDHLAATEAMAQFAWRTYNSAKKGAKGLRRQIHDVQVDLVRTRWTSGSVTDASKGLEFLEKKFKGLYSMAEVFWLRGRMAEERGDFSKALEWFTKGIAEKPLGSDLSEKLLWYGAWNAYRLKKFTMAIDWFNQLLTTSQLEFARARYQYWLAMCLMKSNALDRANEEFARLIAVDPLGYYGLLAHRQIKQEIPAKNLNFDKPAAVLPDKWSDDFKGKVDPLKLQWLVSLGEVELLRNHLEPLFLQLAKTKKHSSPAWLEAFQVLGKVNSYALVYEKMVQLPLPIRTELLETHPELLFPRPFRDTVLKASTQFEVPMELIYAVMRQESGFNPRARSPADAFGLMQLLPEVATPQAARHSITMTHHDDLYLPEVNIPLGAAHLRELFKRHNGQFVLAVASYNASNEAIQNWVRTRYRGDTIEFIEDIPYEETRGYVRLVLRNLIFYRLMENQGQKISFPEELLQLSPKSV